MNSQLSHPLQFTPMTPNNFCYRLEIGQAPARYKMDPYYSCTWSSEML